MKISLFAFGSRGDIQPFLSLGVGLKNVGHNVRIATNKIFEKLVQDYDIEFSPVDGDILAMLQSKIWLKMFYSTFNTIRFVRNVRKLTSSIINQMAIDCLKASKDADVLFFGTWGRYICAPIAEKLHIPIVEGAVIPMHPTRDFPCPLLPISSLRSTSYLNYFSHIILWNIFTTILRPVTNRIRKDLLFLKPLPFWKPSTETKKNSHLILYGISPHVISRPKEWNDLIKMTGYWFLDKPTKWNPSIKLLKFLEDGPPPVYIGFGSINDGNSKEMTKLVVNALTITKQRGILAEGWGGLQGVQDNKNIFTIDEIPHDWLFPKMSIVIHHGGAGTTAAGLRAGVPTIIIPFFSDQSFWGERVFKLGVGAKPIARRILTLDRLVYAIESTINNEDILNHAKQLSNKINQENGIQNAIDLFHEYIKLNLNLTIS